MKKNIRHIILVVAVIFTGILISCEPESFNSDSNAKLKFSTDTITFDTVFTSFGSTTRNFRVYNPYGKTIRISSIQLAGGDNSVFRLNIDGIESTRLSDVEILPHDSIYIFVQVKIDPNASDAALLVNDSIIFTTNGNVQDVNLEAWGQDVHFYNGVNIQSEHWTAGKPYLIHEYLVLDSGSVLTIDAGTKVYLHRNAYMVINGQLEVNGTIEEPVIFQGDRLEEDYQDIPGQWLALAFSPSSSGNHLSYTTIKNGVVIQLGQVEDNRQVSLHMENCKILNMTFAGLYAFGANITGVNTVIANGGSFLMGLLRGGSYRFFHCTFYNQGVIFSNRDPDIPSVILTDFAVTLDEDEKEIYYVGEVKNTFFGNSIIWGTQENEFGYNFLDTDSQKDFYLTHCLIKVNPKIVDVSDILHFDTIWTNSNPQFVDPDKLNFQLDSLSPLKDKGAVSIGKMFPQDFRKIDRTSDIAPDLGAYEWVGKN